MSWEPRFTLEARTARALMRIEGARAAIEGLPVSPQLLASLRQSARLLATHYSTQIEGNQLTPEQVAAVATGGAAMPGRERDAAEVRHYLLALEEMERLAAQGGELTEREVRRLHGLVMHGQPGATPWRDGQNVIRNSTDNAIIYLPPEAKDVPPLTAELLAWTNESLADDHWPVPVIAACWHCQFATIHPFYDGNGRTARLLTNLILHRHGYALKGLYSLEEYYARNLAGYYAALAIGPPNYYMGRAGADMSPFVSYFCQGMAEALENVQRQAAQRASAAAPDHAARLRRLTPSQRQAMTFFRHQQTASAAELAPHLGLTPRQSTALCLRWTAEGFLEMANVSRKARRYRLAAEWERIAAGG